MAPFSSSTDAKGIFWLATKWSPVVIERIFWIMESWEEVPDATGVSLDLVLSSDRAGILIKFWWCGTLAVKHLCNFSHLLVI